MSNKLLTASPSIRHKRIRQFILSCQAIQAIALIGLGTLRVLDRFGIELPVWLNGPLVAASYGILLPGFTAFWLLLRYSYALAICCFLITNTLFYGFLGFIIANATYPRSSLYCQNCEYNLTGNISGICPECGTEVKG